MAWFPIPDQLRGRRPDGPADPRPSATPLNERGCRARFIPWSAPAPPAQQDRLRKCSLATLIRSHWHAAPSTTEPSATAWKLKATASCCRSW